MDDEKLTSILKELRHELQRVLGERLYGVYLYGSRVRGEARPGSDVDVLVVIEGDFDYWELLEETGSSAYELSLKNDILISRVLVSKDDFQNRKTPFLMNVRKEATLV